MNISDVDNQTESEFPHWRPVVSLLLLCLWLFSVLLATLLSSSVLLAIKKSSFINNKALSAVHVYVLVLNILVRVCSAMTFSSFIPPAIRFCDCSIITGSISLYINFFSVFYQPYMFVSLAVFQLLANHQRKKEVCQLQDSWIHTYHHNSRCNSSTTSLHWYYNKRWGSCLM